MTLAKKISRVHRKKPPRKKRPPASPETRLEIAAANSSRDCKFWDWLQAVGKTATSWALEHKTEVDGEEVPRWSPSAVRAWMMPDRKTSRAVPEIAAKLIEVESRGRVRARDDDWPNGISRIRRNLAEQPRT